MLRSNSKKCRQNVRDYIVRYFDPSSYDIPQFPKTFDEIAKCIWDTFKEEKKYDKSTKNIYKKFVSWCQGLPSILDCCYYYNRSARDDMMKIQECEDEEKYKRDESTCEQLLTDLIWEEISKCI